MKRQRKLVVILLIIMFIGTASELFLGAGILRMVVAAWGSALYFISRQAFSHRTSILITLSYIVISCVSYWVVKGKLL